MCEGRDNGALMLAYRVGGGTIGFVACGYADNRNLSMFLKIAHTDICFVLIKGILLCIDAASRRIINTMVILLYDDFEK